MPIYTRTGDGGTTAVFGGKRVSKASLQIDTAGLIDELTSHVGLVRERLKTKDAKILLENIQKDLYKIMSVIAGANIPIVHLGNRTKEFEREIDKVTAELSKLTSFILPGGSEEASLFHILRAMTRKAERAVVALKSDALIIQYLNRLSDLFFTLARKYAKGKEIKIKTL